MNVKRNKFGRFEKVIESEEPKEVRAVDKPELSSSEVTLNIAENLARIAEALSLSAINKLSPLLKKVEISRPIYGLGFNVEKYPPYFKDLCTLLNNIHCSIEQISSVIDAVDF